MKDKTVNENNFKKTEFIYINFSGTDGAVVGFKVGEYITDDTCVCPEAFASYVENYKDNNFVEKTLSINLATDAKWVHTSKCVKTGLDEDVYVLRQNAVLVENNNNSKGIYVEKSFYELNKKNLRIK